MYKIYKIEKSITAQRLIHICQKHNWSTFSIVMPNGDTLTITPSSQIKPCNENTVQFFVIDGPLPWMCAETVDELAYELNTYEKALAKSNAEKIRLRAFFDEHIADGSYDEKTWTLYSDWYKEIYGVRPDTQASKPYAYI